MNPGSVERLARETRCEVHADPFTRAFRARRRGRGRPGHPAPQRGRDCIPESQEPFSPVVVAVPLRFLAYYIAANRGCVVGQPRNLAKRVAVE